MICNFSHLSKQQARLQIQQQRKALPESYFLSSGQEICKTLLSLSQYQAAKTVFCYLSTKTEPSTQLLLEQTLRDKKVLTVPKTAPNGGMEAIPIHSLSQLTVGQFGILEPMAGQPVPIEQLDFAVIPCVSVSLIGQRLGHGGGYYDRFLTDFSGSCFAVCCAKLLTEALPTEAHDISVPCIVTEKSVIFST